MRLLNKKIERNNRLIDNLRSEFDWHGVPESIVLRFEAAIKTREELQKMDEFVQRYGL